MWEIDEVEFAIGSKGVVHFIDKWSSKLERSLTGTANDVLSLIAGIQEILLLHPLQHFLLQIPKSYPVAHLPTLIQLEQKPGIDICLRYALGISAQNILSIVSDEKGSGSIGLRVGDELQVNLHSGEIVLVHGVISQG